MPDTYAFTTTDPAALDAYRQTVAERTAFGERLMTDIAALDGASGAITTHRGFGGPEQIVALAADGTGRIPAGWRIVRDRLEPARGKAGDAARRWLENHQPPDPRYALKAHGFSYQSRVPQRDGYLTNLPALFEYDGRLYAGYIGKPDGDWFNDPAAITAEGSVWTPIPLSQFYAAKEAVDEIRADLAAALR